MKCPICAKPAASDYSPFCSRRCADVDLGKWLTGAYALPSEETDPPSSDGNDDTEAWRHSFLGAPLWTPLFGSPISGQRDQRPRARVAQG